MSATLGEGSHAAQKADKSAHRAGGQPPTVASVTPLHLKPHSPLHSEVVVALAPALDLLSGNDDGHVLRSSLIGMQIAGMLDLGQLAASDLFYALLLKDVGVGAALAESARTYGELPGWAARKLRHEDLSDLAHTLPLASALLKAKAPLTRRLRNAADLLLGARREPAAVARAGSKFAASMALDMGFSHGTASALRSQTERWDGRGRPDGLAGEALPVGSRIIAVASELERLLSSGTSTEALSALEREAARRFDPVIVQIAARLVTKGRLLEQLAGQDLEGQLLELEPPQRRHVALASRVDKLLVGVGRVADSRHAWCDLRSQRVRHLAVGASLNLHKAHKLGVSARRRLARAASMLDVSEAAEPATERVLDLADAALVTETFVLSEGPLDDEPRGEPADPAAERALIGALVRLSGRLEELLRSGPHGGAVSAEIALGSLRQGGEGPPGASRGNGANRATNTNSPEELALSALERFVMSPKAAAILNERGPSDRA